MINTFESDKIVFGSNREHTFPNNISNKSNFKSSKF